MSYIGSPGPRFTWLNKKFTYFSEQFFNVILMGPSVKYLNNVSDKKGSICSGSIGPSIWKKIDTKHSFMLVFD